MAIVSPRGRTASPLRCPAAPTLGSTGTHALVRAGHRRGEFLLDVHRAFFGDVEHDLDGAPADEGEFRRIAELRS